AGIATMAVGNITEIDHVNSIIAAGRADLCCLARPHLSDPYWTLRAAALQGYDGEAIAWPPPYRAGEQQLERLMRRAAEGGGAICPMPGSLEGLHAVVPGGGTGIGAAIATALAADGASLTLMGRRLNRLAAHAATLPGSHALVCDVTDEDMVAARFAE